MLRTGTLTAIGLTGIAGATSARSNDASITFEDQFTGGATVRVEEVVIPHESEVADDGAGGFITIHTWGLTAHLNGPDTIIGVSNHLEPGTYRNVPVRLFRPRSGFSPQFNDLNRLTAELFEPDAYIIDTSNGSEIDPFAERKQLIAVPHADVTETGEFVFTGSPDLDDGESPDVPYMGHPDDQDISDMPAHGKSTVNDSAVIDLPPGR